MVIFVAGVNGEALPDGEIGELLARGPNVFSAYWDQPDMTEKKLEGGWLHTGDMAYRGTDGFFYIAGRKDDMIVRAGMNIYPKEMEDVLLDDPRIREAVVYGQNDPKYGQKLCVGVVPNDGIELQERDIVELCKQRLASYQYPDQVKIVNELPRNAAGKIMRKGVSL